MLEVTEVTIDMNRFDFGQQNPPNGLFWDVVDGQHFIQIEITKEGDAFPQIKLIQTTTPDSLSWVDFTKLNIDNESRGGEVQVITGFKNDRGNQEFVSRTLTQIGVANNIENDQVVITSHINCNVWDLIWNDLPISHAVRGENEDVHFCLGGYITQMEAAMDLPHDHNNGMQLAGVQFVDLPLEQI